MAPIAAIGNLAKANAAVRKSFCDSLYWRPMDPAVMPVNGMQPGDCRCCGRLEC